MWHQVRNGSKMKKVLSVLARLASHIVTAMLFFWIGSGLKQYALLDYEPYAPSSDTSSFRLEKDNLVAMLRNHAGVFVEDEPDLHDVAELSKCFWALSYAMPDRAIELVSIRCQVTEIGLKSAKSKSDKEWMQENLDIARAHLQRLKQNREIQKSPPTTTDEPIVSLPKSRTSAAPD